MSPKERGDLRGEGSAGTSASPKERGDLRGEGSAGTSASPKERGDLREATSTSPKERGDLRVVGASASLFVPLARDGKFESWRGTSTGNVAGSGAGFTPALDRVRDTDGADAAGKVGGSDRLFSISISIAASVGSIAVISGCVGAGAYDGRIAALGRKALTSMPGIVRLDEIMGRAGASSATDGAALTATPFDGLVTMKVCVHFGQRIFSPLSGIRRSSTWYGALHDSHATFNMTTTKAIT